MTRERIAEGLELLVLILGNPGTRAEPPPGWSEHEWAYLRGLASGQLLRLRHELLVTNRSVSSLS